MAAVFAAILPVRPPVAEVIARARPLRMHVFVWLLVIFRWALILRAVRYLASRDALQMLGDLTGLGISYFDMDGMRHERPERTPGARAAGLRTTRG